MREIWVLLILSTVLAVEVNGQAIDQLHKAAAVRSDLESGLARLAPENSYIVQTDLKTKTTTERKLIEGEHTNNTPTQTSMGALPMPGFTPPPSLSAAPQPSRHSRQVFKTVERETLQSVQVHVTLDQSLSQQSITDIKSFVRKYLKNAFGPKGIATFSVVRMLSGQKDAPPASTLPFTMSWALLLTVLAFLLLIAAGFVLMRRRNTVMPQSKSETEPPNARFAPPLTNDSALAQQARSDLFAHFFAHPMDFRYYYLRLNPERRRELYSLLHGPAMDNLLETLELQRPDPATPTSADGGSALQSIATFRGEFDEFSRVMRWQDEQPFGYLARLTETQFVSLLRAVPRLSGATAMRYSSPQLAAAALNALTGPERNEILSQAAVAARLATHELATIEAALRKVAKQVSSLRSPETDIALWREYLIRSNSDEALEELRALRPELYPKLKHLAFRLENAPQLPSSAIQRALSNVDNQILARALVTCPEDTADILLSHLDGTRRELVSANLEAYRNSSKDELVPAREALTRQFREVLP